MTFQKTNFLFIKNELEKSIESYPCILEPSFIDYLKKYNTISNERVAKKISQILNINTHMIIDNIDDELQSFIKNYTENPFYKIEINTNKGKKVEYIVTHLIKAIPKLKIEKGQYFIMQASDRPYPYIMNKKHLDEFKIRYSDLK